MWWCKSINSNIDMTIDLNAKRKKYLIITFIFQLAVAISSLVIGDLVKDGKLNIPLKLYVVVHLLILLAVHYFAFATTCLYFKKKRSKVLYGLLIFGGFLLNFIAESPSIRGQPAAGFIFSLATAILLLAMVIWFVVIVKDIFIEAHDLTYRILGAANIYWLLVVMFAYLYAIFEYSFPGSFGVVLTSKADLINYSFKLSLHSMVGIDHHFDHLELALENFTLIQATISNLFIVFLVGRLLTK